MKKRIWITTQFIGFHCWPDAPAEVNFLRLLHRHVFKVRCEFMVTHADRQLEFFLVQQQVNILIHRDLLPGLQKQQSMSCEMMAEFLLSALLKNYRCISVEVSEDGENGAIVEHEHKEFVGPTKKRARKPRL